MEAYPVKRLLVHLGEEQYTEYDCLSLLCRPHPAVNGMIKWDLQQPSGAMGSVWTQNVDASASTPLQKQITWLRREKRLITFTRLGMAWTPTGIYDGASAVIPCFVSRERCFEYYRNHVA